jgi:hypothetical protein
MGKKRRKTSKEKKKRGSTKVLLEENLDTPLVKLFPQNLSVTRQRGITAKSQF